MGCGINLRAKYGQFVITCVLGGCSRIPTPFKFQSKIGSDQPAEADRSKGSTYRRDTERCLRFLHRKEVIQPQVPLRLPCYDFIPVTSFTLGSYDTSGATGFHDVTGGVYKTRERIHAAVADAALLAIPASWRRVAASNPNWAQF